MKVLLAGAAGRIGQVLCKGLADCGHTMIGLDKVAVDSRHTRWHQVDCRDAAALRSIFEMEQPEAVIHLAGHPGETSLPAALESHAITTAAVLEASVAQGVRRFVYASSNHAVGYWPRTEVLPVDAPHRPDTFYGVSKVTAEALLSLYADRYDLSTIACRIGSFRSEPDTRRALSTWLSHADCVRMFDACLTASTTGFVVIYGISANRRAWWDLDAGRALGYLPQDDAEVFADRLPARPDDDDAEAMRVGGLFATERVGRPAFDEAP